jgi:hypothetical protein
MVNFRAPFDLLVVGGASCDYPGERFSRSRMLFDHLMFYGILLDFVATSVAAIYDHFLNWQAPCSGRRTLVDQCGVQ